MNEALKTIAAWTGAGGFVLLVVGVVLFVWGSATPDVRGVTADEGKKGIQLFIWLVKRSFAILLGQTRPPPTRAQKLHAAGLLLIGLAGVLLLAAIGSLAAAAAFGGGGGDPASPTPSGSLAPTAS